MHLRNFERNLDYYKVTFSDPLYAAFQFDEDMRKSIANKSSSRKKNINKSLLMQTFAKQVIKPEELVGMIEDNLGNLEDNSNMKK